MSDLKFKLSCKEHNQEVTSVCLTPDCVGRLLCTECTSQHNTIHPATIVSAAQVFSSPSKSPESGKSFRFGSSSPIKGGDTVSELIEPIIQHFREKNGE